jgi:TatD DNase family protein
VAFAVGVHPWYIRPEHEAELARLHEAPAWGACAIGEIGLDKKVTAPPYEVQQRVFETQLGIARRLGLPVIVHCRGAFDDLLRILKGLGALPGGGIVHNFSGSAELVHEVARYGLAVSLGGTLTYRNSRKKREVVAAAYPDRLVLETDSPDLPPVEAPGRPNVPANIVYALRAAAEALDVPEEEVAACTTRNARRIFGLGGADS